MIRINEEIRLREMRIEDASDMLEWMHDSDIEKGLLKGFTNYSLSDAQSFIKGATFRDTIENGDSIHCAISGADDEYFGTISLKNMDFNNRNAELAIVMRKKAQGKGIATTAIRLLLDRAFNEYNFHRVYLSVLADNERAIRLYEKVGFKLEGVFREHICKDNKYIDWKMYGILRGEFHK